MSNGFYGDYWHWLGYESRAVIIASVIDSDWARIPAAMYVTGNYGEPHIDQFSGAGPSSSAYSFKALVVDGVCYIPDPHTRGIDKPESRRWVIAPVQPPSYALRPVVRAQSS